MAAHSAPASSGREGGRVVGDYMFGRQIGSGSFSVVWHARHRLRGTEVAVKEIVMDRLSNKLRESLLSEIVILKRVSHPNIIALYDIIEAPGKIYLVLEYCRGGDLSMFIQRHGRLPEATAKHFMQQLAAGLLVLRDNNLIHRDLKPQNLLLSTFDDENSVLKIADFGFARSLQPRGLAETLCGSPLYMAPEIMQLQKYDAKADLWSVGAILFQLVTGKTPFTGNNQIQLLQNIVKNDLRFPPGNNLSDACIDLCQKLLRRNPVQRLTFQEFFNHSFLYQCPPGESLSQTSINTRDGFPLVENSPARPLVESCHDECLPFILDDESSGQDGSLSISKGLIGSAYGSSVDSVHKSPACSPSKHKSPACSPSKIGLLSRNSSTSRRDISDSHSPLGGIVRETKLAVEQRRSINVPLKDSTVVDSLEFIDQDYVLVSGPPLEMSSSSVSTSQPRNSPCKSESSPMVSPKFSAPMSIVGAAIRTTRPIGSLESHSSPASGTSQGSMDMGDAMEQPSVDLMTRIRSLQQCASVITELVKEEVGNGRRLEAFSIQLVVLAIWKQALHICHAQAASAIEGGLSQELRARASNKHSPDTQECVTSVDSQQMSVVCSQIEREFLLEIGRAEELARDLGKADETTEMPDAMEIIFQSALLLGRRGGVEEMMNNTEIAASQYSKAVCLLRFLLVEAPSLALNPPFSPTKSDRYRLCSYINALNNIQGQSYSQRSAHLKCEDR